MIFHRPCDGRGTRLFGLVLAGLLPLGAVRGQVPIIPRAEPAGSPSTAPARVDPEPVAAPEEAPAEKEPEADPPPKSAPAITLAALVREVNPYALVLEPADNGSEVFVPVAGAKASGLAAARWDGGIMRPYTREEFRALDLKWKEFRARGLEEATRALDLIEPILERDLRGTVTLVRFVSESPLTATTLFTASFRKRLEDVLGLPFYAVAPSRSVVLAFAKEGNDPSTITKIAGGLYKDAIYPASLEIFEVKKEGIRAVGTINED